MSDLADILQSMDTNSRNGQNTVLSPEEAHKLVGWLHQVDERLQTQLDNLEKYQQLVSQMGNVAQIAGENYQAKYEGTLAKLDRANQKIDLLLAPIDKLFAATHKEDRSELNGLLGELIVLASQIHRQQEMHAEKEGWVHLSNDRRWHYFRMGRSLCGRYGLKPSGAYLFEADGEPSPEDCALCRRKLEKEKKRAPTDPLI